MPVFKMFFGFFWYMALQEILKWIIAQALNFIQPQYIMKLSWF